MRLVLICSKVWSSTRSSLFLPRSNSVLLISNSSSRKAEDEELSWFSMGWIGVIISRFEPISSLVFMSWMSLMSFSD